MFNDQGIERSTTIAPSLVQVIRESRILVVILSKNYASSSWCLNELVEILECKKVTGQVVMTIFYGVDPSDVRKQTGDFGSAFKKTCSLNTDVERQIWITALTNVSNIAGEDCQNWDTEANMIEKIAEDISRRLNATPSKDFEGIVGLEAHLKKMQSLLHLDCEDEAMIVGICGPAGIGKTTIARALHNRLSPKFQLTCFMENIRVSYNSGSGFDEYGLKLSLQKKLLSMILNQNGTTIHHLGTIQERLRDQKVLIFLDDVDDLKQLEALANETRWFGCGSRIIITTEDQEILEQHGINNTYQVNFPSREDARKIFCRYAFRPSSPPDGFEKLTERVTEICSNLPLGLRVMGSFLRGKNQDEWEVILQRLENSLDRDIERVLRVGYDSLHANEQSLFLHIAFFFNNEEEDHVMAMLGDSNLDVRLGLKTLAYKSLIKISMEGKIVMHRLLQQMGRQAIQRQEPWKRQILIDTDEICDVLQTDSGGRSVVGISFDISKILDGMFISPRAFKNMQNLRFLSVYKTKFDAKDRIHVPEDMDFPHRLRVLQWKVYPGKYLPHSFCPKYLVKLDLQDNHLEKLWQGAQPLRNLKEMVLSESSNLKEVPDLSNATNLEKLILTGCKSLVELPSSIGNLHRLKWLGIAVCVNLQVIPAHINLESLEWLDMLGCSQLRKFPEISMIITTLTIADTMLVKLLESVRVCSSLRSLGIIGSLNTFPDPHGEKKFLNRSGADIERIPDCIKELHGLKLLYITGCPKLASLPEFPVSLKTLMANTCESLETVSFSLDSPIEDLYFCNCFRLGQEARRVITKQSVFAKACLPGRKMPAEFNQYRATGSSLTVPSGFHGFKICVVISPKQKKIEKAFSQVLCRISSNGCLLGENIVYEIPIILTEHLCISQTKMLDEDGRIGEENEILFEFSITTHQYSSPVHTPQVIDIIECGVRILTREKATGEIKMG